MTFTLYHIVHDQMSLEATLNREGYPVTPFNVQLIQTICALASVADIFQDMCCKERDAATGEFAMCAPVPCHGFVMLAGVSVKFS